MIGGGWRDGRGPRRDVVVEVAAEAIDVNEVVCDGFAFALAAECLDEAVALEFVPNGGDGGFAGFIELCKGLLSLDLLALGVPAISGAGRAVGIVLALAQAAHLGEGLADDSEARGGIGSVGEEGLGVDDEFGLEVPGEMVGDLM